MSPRIVEDNLDKQFDDMGEIRVCTKIALVMQPSSEVLHQYHVVVKQMLETNTNVPLPKAKWVVD